MNMTKRLTMAGLSLAVALSAGVAYADEGLLKEIRRKEADWARKRVWQPDLSVAGETEPVTCRVVTCPVLVTL